jgi:hypothetical protein
MDWCLELLARISDQKIFFLPRSILWYLQVAECPESHMTIVAQALEPLKKKCLPTEIIGN